MRIAFISDKIDRGSAAQHLGDRFKIGFTRDGIFRPSRHEITDQIANADAVILMKREAALETLRSAGKIPVFIYGSVPLEAFEMETPVFCGTEISTALQLPAVKVGRAREALIVVQGESSEITGLNGLIPLLKNPRPIKRVRRLEGEAIWTAAEKKEWSWGLLRAALSRTDSPQGNAIVDGRVEDMSLQARELAKNPRALLIEHEDRLRTTVLQLDGVVGDVVMAIDDGRIHSAQLFHAPSPMREDFSRLALAIEEFFVTKKSPISREVMRIIAFASVPSDGKMGAQ
jgi:hypothetical protein